MKAMSKYQLAAKAGVQWYTMKKWIKGNKIVYERICELGYEDKTKLLNPSIVKYLCDTFVID